MVIGLQPPPPQGKFRSGNSVDYSDRSNSTSPGQSGRHPGVYRPLVENVGADTVGYEDADDCDAVRGDPLFKLAVGRAPESGRDLCSQPTMGRLEHAPAGAHRYRRIGHDAGVIEALFVDLFLDAHEQTPERLVLGLDATDDPLHGRQEGRFFYGYYDCYCYLPLYIFCGEHLLAAKLRRANIDASAGAVEEVERIVGQIRTRWPAVEIVLRADAGFAREPLMARCEDNAVDYVFGLAGNRRLTARLQPAQDRAEARSRESGQPERLFTEFRYRTRNTRQAAACGLDIFKRRRYCWRKETANLMLLEKLRVNPVEEESQDLKRKVPNPRLHEEMLQEVGRNKFQGLLGAGVSRRSPPYLAG